MAHFALLDKNNIVQAVFFGRDEDNEIDISLRTGETYKQTSYNTRGGKYYEWRNGLYQLGLDQSKAFRKNYAGIGFTYDANLNAFIPPKPFASWTLNTTTCGWEAPSLPPVLTQEELNDSKKYKWSEDLYQTDNSKGWQLTQFKKETGIWEVI
jgi:hypothetical protein